jgi:7-carboxy-7-deazaguanine synthase
MHYWINDIYPTIQGEGHLTGTPMILVRLQGCSVHCSWCDTKDTWVRQGDPLGGGRRMRVGDIVSACMTALDTQADWILLTGGEPTEQDLKPLFDQLEAAGYYVALETSGTGTGGLDGIHWDWLCLSPKFHAPPLDDYWGLADEIKFIVTTEDDIAQIDRLLKKFGGRFRHRKNIDKILLQPVSQSPTATELCIKTVQERAWRLSVQLHKYLNLP